MDSRKGFKEKIPGTVCGIVLVVLVGVASFLCYLVVSAVLNRISEGIQLDVRGLVYVTMFALNIALYYLIGRWIFSGRRFDRKARRKCVVMTEILLVGLQLAGTAGVPALGFLSVWIGGLGYMILYFYSLLSPMQILGLLLAYMLGLMIPAICILGFTGEKSYVHR